MSTVTDTTTAQADATTDAAASATAAAHDELETVRLVNGLSCELPANSPLAKLLHSQRTWVGPDAKQRLRILNAAKSVAIVGASPNPARSSFFVGTYLQQSSDYRLYFVNPNATEILGQPAYASLQDLPEVPDIVVVFRRGSDIPGVVDEVVASGAKTIWVQLGIWNQDAAYYGEEQGLTVVMDRCIKVEHARFHGGLHLLGFDTGQITARKTIR
jgi:predicted CoA-binding protein